MQPEAKKYLFDMREAARLVREFVAGKTLREYVANPLLRSAVERQLMVLGEAMAQLSGRHPTVASRIPQSRAIIDFRNVLVHGYDVIDDEIVWGVTESKLPDLAAELDALLAEPED
jgi:uncharacterized protein with HEPN domain